MWAPDSKRLAVTAANRLFTIDLDTNAAAEVAYNQAGGYQVSQFSPDGKWLIYARSDDQQNRDIYAFEIAAKREHNLTESPFTEMRGVLTPDGKKLVFVSDRADGVNHLFVVSVEKLAEDPDDPLVKERLKGAAEKGAGGEEGGEGPGGTGLPRGCRGDSPPGGAVDARRGGGG